MLFFIFKKLENKRFAALAALLLGAPVMAAGSDVKDLASLGGVNSIYTQPLFEVLTALQKQTDSAQSATNPSDVALRCWTTPGNELYIGLDQRFTVDAPLARVREVLDDFDHYREFFKGFRDIHVIPNSRSANRLEVYWEQIIPIFFIPNAKYESIYQIDGDDPRRAVYRYQLKQPAALKASDGFVYLKKDGDNKTDYIEYDFFDADWGAAKILGREKIWKDSIEGMLQSDLAIKLKAENQLLTNSQAQDRSIRLAEGSQKTAIDGCFESRKPFAAH